MSETPAGEVAEGVAQLTVAVALEVTVSRWHWYSLDQAAAATTFVRTCAELERNPGMETRCVEVSRADAGR